MSEKIRKYTVITGASSGIGYEAAKAFAKRGKNLVITARRENNLVRLKRVTGFLLALYDSEKTVGLVDRESFSFRLTDPLFPYARNNGSFVQ